MSALDDLSTATVTRLARVTPEECEAAERFVLRRSDDPLTVLRALGLAAYEARQGRDPITRQNPKGKAPAVT